MRTIDFSPLYRSTVGFDRMFFYAGQYDQSGTCTNLPPL